MLNYNKLTTVFFSNMCIRIYCFWNSVFTLINDSNQPHLDLYLFRKYRKFLSLDYHPVYGFLCTDMILI